MSAPVELVAHVGEENAHLLKYWPELTEAQRDALAKQLKSIDFEECREAFMSSAMVYVPNLENVRPIDADRHVISFKLPKDELDRYKTLGLEAISKNELSVMVLAGGQASRLGSQIPKGTLPLGLTFGDATVASGDSLLAIQAAKLARLQELSVERFPGTSGKIQWLVMTSIGTEKLTKEHLDKIVPDNGLSLDQVTVFSQANIPAFDFEGKFLLSSKDEVCTAPNGNGGIYAALSEHLPRLRRAGSKYIHVYCVDNILCHVGDPAMLGMMIDKDADCAAKTVEKQPGELVGSITLDDGKARVVEYSELAAFADKTGPDGKLLFRAGSIANHFFSLSFLESFCTPSFHLPYHRALKKIAHVGPDGVLVKPSAPNGIKLEQFIFDVFPMSKNFYAWDVERENEFSPLKNAESAGKDCLSTCIRDLAAQSRRWLEAAGAIVPAGTRVFIASSRSYAGENLEEFRGTTITSDIVL